MADKNQANFELLKKYIEVEGISRHEEEVAQLFKKSTQHLGVEYLRDGLGSICAYFPKFNKGPKVLLGGHLDEIGFVVLDYLDNGQLRLAPVGGIYPPTMVGSKLELVLENEKLYGVVGHTSVHVLPPEARNKALELKDLFADFGFKSKQEAIDRGVEPGTVVNVKSEPFLMLNGLFAGKSIDNRYSMAVLEAVMINVASEKQLPCQPYFAGHVQEEVGLRGAKTMHKVVKPDVCIAVDVCASFDTQNCIPGITKCGDGMVITIRDALTAFDPYLIKYATKLAKKHNIKLIKSISQGGVTDAAEMQYAGFGVPTLLVSIPERYLHSPLGVADLNDFEETVKFLTAFIKEFSAQDLDEIILK